MANSLKEVEEELNWGLALFEATGQRNITISPESAKILIYYISLIKEIDNGQNIIDA